MTGVISSTGSCQVLCVSLDATTVLRVITELVASFEECQHGSPWPSWRPRAVAEGGAVRTRRGTPRPRGGWHAPDHRLVCSCTPERYEPQRHARSPDVSSGEADQQPSQPVKRVSIVQVALQREVYAAMRRVSVRAIGSQTVRRCPAPQPVWTRDPRL
jgi:hypothetical protein